MTAAPRYKEETISTLKFGALCKKIKNTAQKNSAKNATTMLREYKIKIMELKKALEMSNAGGKGGSSGGNGEGASSNDLSTELARVKANADKEKHEMEKMKRQLEILRSGIFSGRQDSKTMGASGGDRKDASRRGSVGGMKRRQSMIVRGSGLTGLFPSKRSSSMAENGSCRWKRSLGMQ